MNNIKRLRGLVLPESFSKDGKNWIEFPSKEDYEKIIDYLETINFFDYDPETKLEEKI
jgi:hypothetical protein